MLSVEQKKEKNLRLLASTPVFKAVIALSLPTMLSQMIGVIYNIADTLFIGRLNDPIAVAGVTFSMPLIIIFNAVANLFGVGGAAFISHCLGRGDAERARKGSAFSIYCSLGLALIYTAVIGIFRDLLFPAMGASGEALAYMKDYTFYTLILGTVPAIMSPLLAHLVRSEGASLQGSIGLAMGGILNILLDPLFIFACGMGVAGAGLATFLSNVVACIYLIVYIFIKRRVTTINAIPRNFLCGKASAKEIIVAGLPNAVVSIMAFSSNILSNYLFSAYGDQVVAGWGIAKKIDLLAFAISQGMTQGALPLIAYSYSARNKERMHQAIKWSFIDSMIVAALGFGLLFGLSRHMAGLFIDDEVTVTYAEAFTRILCVACLTTTPCFVVITIFQALGKKVQPFVLSFFRKGIFNMIFSLIFAYGFGEYGIAAATPAADFVAMSVSLVVFFVFWHKFKKQELAETKENRDETAPNS